jgi:hypothetical protein
MERNKNDCHVIEIALIGFDFSLRVTERAIAPSNRNLRLSHPQYIYQYGMDAVSNTTSYKLHNNITEKNTLSHKILRGHIK